MAEQDGIEPEPRRATKADRHCNKAEQIAIRATDPASPWPAINGLRALTGL